MWNNWIIFQKFDSTTDAMQIKKQIGILQGDKQDFTVRPSLIHPPGL